MKLYESEIGKSYIVRDVLIEERLTRRLEALGVNERTRITILNKKKSGTLIIKVRGTRLALGQKIADGIEVSEMDGSGEPQFSGHPGHRHQSGSFPSAQEPSRYRKGGHIS